MTPHGSRVHFLSKWGVILTSVALMAAASLLMTQSSASAAPQPLARQGPNAQVPAWQPAGQTAHLLSGLDPHATGITNTVATYNWSGYVDTGPVFTAVSAQWVVPTVLPSQSAQYSSTWIGIDGYPANDTSLIQTGTAQQTSGGTTSYYDWYEILPNYAVEIGSVSPGDHMTASIQKVTSGTWLIAITDTTSGNVFSEPFSYSGGGSAEWIEEAPLVSGDQSTLADFGSASFSNMADTNSGSPAVTSTQLDMVNSSGSSVIASPGTIANNAFTITYSGPVPAPPVVQSTTTTVSVNPSSSTSGTAVTYYASVTSAGGTPTGTVTFSVGTSTLCTTGALVGGDASCSTSTAPEGTDTVTGTYSGSSDFTASSGTTTLAVSAPPAATTSTPSPTPAASSQHGYWLVGSDGGIFTFGAAQFYGSTGALTLQRPVVGITPTANDGGYWLVASDGGIFSFGNAGYYGSIPGLGIAPAGSTNPKRLNAPIVGMVPSADGAGYFMVASDGGVFAFGDAKFEGSCPGIGGCSGAAVAVMPDASGNGYWLVTATGQVYAFGDAINHGAPGPQSAPVTAAVRTNDGGGYWILFANGVVAPYGDAASLGGPAGAVGGLNPASAIFTTSDGGGYWVASADGSLYTYGDAPNDGSMAGQHLNGLIIAAAGW